MTSHPDSLPSGASSLPRRRSSSPARSRLLVFSRRRAERAAALSVVTVLLLSTWGPALVNIGLLGVGDAVGGGLGEARIGLRRLRSRRRGGHRDRVVALLIAQFCGPAPLLKKFQQVSVGLEACQLAAGSGGQRNRYGAAIAGADRSLSRYGNGGGPRQAGHGGRDLDLGVFILELDECDGFVECALHFSVLLRLLQRSECGEFVWLLRHAKGVDRLDALLAIGRGQREQVEHRLHRAADVRIVRGGFKFQG